MSASAPSLPFHEIVTAADAAPDRTVYVLHGVYGTGRNWRGFARRFVAAHPTWRVVLVHLRGHGGSKDLPPPHTMHACALDLARLADSIGPPDVVWGHSFGGKVALTWVRDACPGTLQAVWSLDSPPGAGPSGGGDPVSSEVGRVLAHIAELRTPIPRRSDAQAHFMTRGLSRPVAGWMATNLVAVDGGFSWHFSPATLTELLRDYWPPRGVAIHLVRAVRSDRWTPSDLERLDALAERPGVRIHVMEDAGHWLHVDNPKGLMTLLTASD